MQDEARLRFFVTDRLPDPAPGAVYSFSGGVADLMDDRPRAPFAYGDLGVLLGRAVAKSAVGPRIPARETIRATVIGAGCHATELSGSTVYFDRIAFPLKNLPVAALTPEEERFPPAELAETVRARLAVFADGPAVLALQGRRDLHFAALSALPTGWPAACAAGTGRCSWPWRPMWARPSDRRWPCVCRACRCCASTACSSRRAATSMSPPPSQADRSCRS